MFAFWVRDSVTLDLQLHKLLVWNAKRNHSFSWIYSSWFKSWSVISWHLRWSRRRHSIS